MSATATTSSPISAAINPAAASSSSSSSSSSGTGVDNTTIAGNFQTFLTLLTAQLQNQNPLDPLDTNQFTQQLVQFAGVEQQMKQNDQLSQLLAIEKTAQTTSALAYIGRTVAIDGASTALSNGTADWTLTSAKTATATVTIKDSSGQTAYSGAFAIAPGKTDFTWDGRGNDGKLWPDGNYTMTATGVDVSGQSVGISTEVQATIDSVDVSQTPPTMSVAGKDYTLDKIRRIIN